MARSHHRIVELDEQRCRELLTDHGPHVGRVAFAEDGDPDWPTVLPVNYTYHDGDIFFRTFVGSKLFAALRRQRVAFEVDEIDDVLRTGWSVVALGSLDVVQDPAAAAAIDDTLESWAADHEEQLVRIAIEQLSGREVIGPGPAGESTSAAPGR